LIVAALGKINKKLMLTLPEFVLFFAVIHVCAGWHFEEFGMVELGAGSIPLAGPLYTSLYLAGTEPYNELAQYVPDYWAPISDPEIVHNAMYGGPINWAAYIPALSYQIVYFLLWIILGMTWTFFLRKPLIEEEMLPFSGMQVSLTQIAYAYKKEPGSEKPRMFDFKLTLTKLFWVGVILGFIFNSTDMVRFFLPVVPSTWVFVYWVDLTPQTRTFLPGAFLVSNFRVTDVFLAFLVPISAAASIVIFHFIFSVLYHSIGVWTGALPYYVGVETISRNYYGWQVGPFKYCYMTTFGTIAGVAIWLVYRNRRHFADMFRAAFGAKDVPKSEAGVSYRAIVFGAIGSFICLLILLVANGQPVPAALSFVVWYIATLFLYTRFMAEYWEPLGRQGWAFAWPAYDAGAIFGCWPAIPPGGPASFASNFLSTCGYPVRGLAYAGDQTFPIYKVAHEFKVSAKSLFIILLITTIVSALVAWPFSLWWYHTHGGFSQLNQWPDMWRGRQPYIYSLTKTGEAQWGVDPAVPFSERASLTLAGIVLTLVMFWLRSHFSWFFLNPTFLWMISLQEWFWLATFVAMIFKIIVIKVGGARAYRDYGVPLSVGVLSGYGLAYVIFQLLVFFTVVIPKM